MSIRVVPGRQYVAAVFTATLFAWLLCSAAANGQSAPFFQGKTIRIVVGFSSGGRYDQYARILARQMPKHIPGNPTIIVQNMPGAEVEKQMREVMDQPREVVERVKKLAE